MICDLFCAQMGHLQPDVSLVNLSFQRSETVSVEVTRIEYRFLSPEMIEVVGLKLQFIFSHFRHQLHHFYR